MEGGIASTAPFSLQGQRDGGEGSSSGAGVVSCRQQGQAWSSAAGASIAAGLSANARSEQQHRPGPSRVVNVNQAVSSARTMTTVYLPRAKRVNPIPGRRAGRES